MSTLSNITIITFLYSRKVSKQNLNIKMAAYLPDEDLEQKYSGTTVLTTG